MTRCIFIVDGYVDGKTVFRCESCDRTTPPLDISNASQVRATCRAEQPKSEYCRFRSPDIAYSVDSVKVTCRKGPRVCLQQCELHGRLTTVWSLDGLERAAVEHVVKDYDGLTCHGCPEYGRYEEVDILHVTPRERWQNMIERARFALNANGIQATIRELVKPPIPQLEHEIAERKPKAVLIHAFCVNSECVCDLAVKHPTVRFIVFTHSKENHIQTYPQHFSDMVTALAMSRRLPNLIMGGAFNGQWNRLGYDTETWYWPCLIESSTKPPPVEPHRMLISSRCDLVKAIPATIVGCSIAQRKTGCRVAVSLKGAGRVIDGLRKLTEATGAGFEWWPWVEHDEFLERLRSQVSLIVQPSMSETFNYCTWEAGSVGRPWVGSSAIAHTPLEWRADPNEPSDIADKILAILDDYEACSARARRIAEDVAERNNASYAEAVRRWLAKE